MKALIEQAARFVLESRHTIVLTGAGISTESGIPDFRSAQGLWARYDPAEYASIESFRSNPEKVWNMLRDMNEIVDGARPNNAHKGLGELEKMGYVHCVITQNIDNLHQEGGSRNVIEYHGNSSTLSCLWCGRNYSANSKKDEEPPNCECGKILKPDVIFFGEAIPQDALTRSYEHAREAEALLVVGTSAVVSPANTIPSVVKRQGAKVVEINMEATHLTDSVTDVFLQGKAGEIVPALVKEVKAQAEARGRALNSA